MSTTPVVAILSPGEMGHAIGRVLVHHGPERHRDRLPEGVDVVLFHGRPGALRGA